MNALIKLAFVTPCMCLRCLFRTRLKHCDTQGIRDQARQRKHTSCTLIKSEQTSSIKATRYRLYFKCTCFCLVPKIFFRHGVQIAYRFSSQITECTGALQHDITPLTVNCSLIVLYDLSRRSSKDKVIIGLKVDVWRSTELGKKIRHKDTVKK